MFWQNFFKDDEHFTLPASIYETAYFALVSPIMHS